MFRFLLFCGFFFIYSDISAQNRTILSITEDSTKLPIASVTIWLDNKFTTQSDLNGKAIINIEGNHMLSFTAVGYQKKWIKILLPDTNVIEIRLEKEQIELEEVTIISSTRNNQTIENAPIKVEVLDSEEMEEESTVKPADILGIIGDASGLQVQQSDAISGNANIRIQGLEGRYTQILRDGFPLYEGYSGGFGLTSVPPLDLKQIELIKGSASTLFGGGAIGGLVNLISKKPSSEQEGVITLNQTSLKETNFNNYFSKRYKKIGYSFYAGLTNRSSADVNKDGISDVSQNKTTVLHPRLFFYPNNSTNIVLGVTITNDEGFGGDMKVIEGKGDSTHSYFQKNDVRRISGDILFEKNFSDNNKLTVKTSLSNYERKINTSSHYFKAEQMDYYSEIALLLKKKKSNWITGINFTGSHFSKLQGDIVYLKETKNNTVGIFTQYNYTIFKNTSIEAGLRDDYSDKYFNFLLPRIAIFKKINDHWGARLGVGAGYKLPNALSPQIKDYEIENILPINTSVQAEHSIGYNAEINYKKKWNNEKTLFINHAFFLTQINKPVIASEDTSQLISFSNALKPIVTKGFDTYVKLKVQDWEFYAGCTYTIAERKYLSNNQFMPLTPPFRMACMLTREIENKGRFCIEASYNGKQYRVDYSRTPAYFFMAAMAQITLQKHIDLIINCENIFDYRQSKIEKLFSGNISNPVFNPLWAPIDGRIVNACIKFRL